MARHKTVLRSESECVADRLERALSGCVTMPGVSGGGHCIRRSVPRVFESLQTLPRDDAPDRTIRADFNLAVAGQPTISVNQNEVGIVRRGAAIGIVIVVSHRDRPASWVFESRHDASGPCGHFEGRVSEAVVLHQRQQFPPTDARKHVQSVESVTNFPATFTTPIHYTSHPGGAS
jgi:hypothetical protein